MSRRILIIDDEENIRRVTRLTLETAGFEVGEASDGARGLEAYGDGSNWSAVLLDQRMPGMDGLETLRQIKDRDVNARVIMVTAYASIELAVDAMKLGATDFVRKPMTPETLRNAVAAALSKQMPVSPVAAASAAEPLIQTLTMNGFSIVESEAVGQAPDERRYTVESPGGGKHDVVVKIDAEAIGYVERMTRRRLPADSSFWTAQAERLLSNYLWAEGKIPPARTLTVDDVEVDDLPLAERWSDGPMSSK